MTTNAPGLVTVGGLGTGAPAATTRLRANQDEFLDALTRARSDVKDPPEVAARKAAEALVSASLVQPIFKKMRESSSAAAPFAPNQAERTFGSMRDAAFAQRLVSSQRWALVDNLARRMLERSGHSPKAVEATA